MAKLATDQAYGGQRVSLGRVAIVWPGRFEHPTSGICCGFVGDEPRWAEQIGGAPRVLRFQPDAASLEPGEWTWPPRV